MPDFSRYISKHITKKYADKKSAFNQFAKTYCELSRQLSDAEEIVNPLYKKYNGPTIEGDDSFFTFGFINYNSIISGNDVPSLIVRDKNGHNERTIILKDWMDYTDKVMLIRDDPDEEDEIDGNEYSYEEDYNNNLSAELRWVNIGYDDRTMVVELYHADGTLRYTYTADLSARVHNAIIKFTYASKQSKPRVLFNASANHDGDIVLIIRPDNEVSSVYIQDETNHSQYARNPIDV